MKHFLLWLIRAYQGTVRVRSCRFIPSCSEYAYQAIARHGIVKGCFLGVRRVLRCHPYSKGGVDRVA